MKRKILQNLLLFVLALVFSAGLMYAFIALPQWLDGVFQRTVSGIGHDPGYMPERPDYFIQAYRLKLVGSISLIVIGLFIVVGLVTRKTGFAWVGAIALFLPVFGTFAFSMFYLAGLGIFNTLLLPFMDWDMAVLSLGDVVLVPYKILLWFFGLFDWHAHDFILYACMGTGAFLFVFSVFTWLQTYYSRQKVAKSWLYRYSRHPQYLGWMIWSYGLMLFGPTLNNMKKSWGWNGSLAWLLSTMVIIGICMLEELRMRDKAGEEYDYYRDKTPFLFPMPRILKRLVKLPGKLIVHDKYPTKSRQIGLIVLLYTIVLMGFSLFWTDFSKTEVVTNRKPMVSDTIGLKDLPHFVEQLNHKDWWKRTAALKSIYAIDPVNSWSHIYEALQDPEDPVKTEALWIILQNPQPEAEQYVRPFIEDQSWEVRFLAREVLKGV